MCVILLQKVYGILFFGGRVNRLLITLSDDCVKICELELDMQILPSQLYGGQTCRSVPDCSKLHEINNIHILLKSLAAVLRKILQHYLRNDQYFSSYSTDIVFCPSTIWHVFNQNTSVVGKVNRKPICATARWSVQYVYIVTECCVTFIQVY